MKNTGICVCHTPEYLTVGKFWANEEGLPLMILSDHFETAPFYTHHFFIRTFPKNAYKPNLRFRKCAHKLLVTNRISV